jgi:hypothetical protein
MIIDGENIVMEPKETQAMEILAGAAMFASTVIARAEAGADIEAMEVLHLAEQFGLRIKRNLTDEEKSNPETLMKLFGIDPDGEITTMAPAFGKVLQGIVANEDLAPGQQEAAE